MNSLGKNLPAVCCEMKTVDDYVKPPMWRVFSSKGWFDFVNEFKDYRSQGGSLGLSKCISVNCKTLTKLEFAYDRWKRDDKPKTDAKKSKTDAREDVDDDEAFDDEVISRIGTYFAPVSTFAAETKFRELRMASPSLEAYRNYVLAFASLESQCSAAVLPPARSLAKIFSQGVLPAAHRERLISTDYATWAEARAEGFNLVKDLERLSYLSASRGVQRQDTVQQVVSAGGTDQGSSNSQDKLTRICYTCRQPGHIAKTCPQRVAAIATVPPLDGFSDEMVSWPIVDDTDSGEEKRRTKTTARRFGSFASDEEG